MQHQTSTHAGNILSSYGNPCKLDPCPCVCYLHVLTKEQGKGKWALPKKILPRLWTTIWQRKAVWKTLFQNKPSGTINPVYLPLELLNKTKKVSINKTLSNISQLFPNMFDPAALKEHPIHNNDLHRVALAQHLLYHSKGEMLRREQSKGHRKGTRARQKNIQSL